MLCHGNICRSPLAHAVLAKLLGPDRVRSRALKGYDRGLKTMPPAPLKIREFAAEQGYDLSGHRAAMVRPADLNWADLILYMDNGNRERMGEVMTTNNWEKAVCLASYIGRDRLPDPAFTKRGPELVKLLTWVQLAAEECGRRILAGLPPPSVNEKTPEPSPGSCNG